MVYVDATFAGIHADAGAGDATFALGLGPEPSGGQVALKGTGHSMASGDLVLTDGDTTVTLPNLTVEERTEHEGRDGEYTIVKLKDRRWQWATRAHVTGEWNKPEADGTTIPAALQKTARELVALCLDAMDEDDYDVSALPNDFYPYVKWEFEPAAQAAQEVCDMCRATLTLNAGDHAEVVVLGSGDSPPDNIHKTQQDTGVRYVGLPDKYVVRGARKIIQRTDTLEPVALDTDGVVKAFEDLSYYDTVVGLYGSFGAALDARFFGLKGVDDAAWKSANESAGLWFRLPAAVLELLPVLSSICAVKDEAGKKKWKRPYVTASVLWIKGNDGEFHPQGSGELNVPWDMDADAGIVKVAVRPFVAEESSTLAELKLVWAYESRQSDGSLTDDDYYVYEEGEGTAERVESAEWLVLRGVIAEGESDPVWQNDTELDAIAAKMVDLIEETDPTLDSGEIDYRVILDVRPDGALRQVTWTVGRSGASTQLVHNSDRPPLGRRKLDLALDALRNRAKSAAGFDAARRFALARAAKPEAAPAQVNRLFGRALNRYELGVVLDGEADAPRGGLVRLNFEGMDATEKVAIASKPDRAGLADLGIVTAHIPGLRLGVVRDSGTHRVLYLNRDDMPTTARNCRLGSSKDSWYAKPQARGPLLVRYVIAEPADGNPGIAMVSIEGGNR